MQEQYQVAFDLSRQPSEFQAWMIPLVALPAVGLLLVISPQSVVDRIFTRGPKGAAGKLFSWVFFLFSSFLAATVLLGYLNRTTFLKSAQHAGHVSIVEGCLQYFHPMPEEGHENERIKIGDRLFEYSDYDVTYAFNNTESHGGPIHPDSKLRLTAVGDDIVKVEVKQRACPAAPDFPKTSGPS